MRNSLWILLLLGALLGTLPDIAAADQIQDADVSIDVVIDDGNPADLHDDNGWLVAGSGVTSTIRVTYTGNESPDIHYVKFTSVEKETYGDITGGCVAVMPYDAVFTASQNRAGIAPILVQINYTMNGVGYDYFRTVYQPIDHAIPMKIRTIAFESEVTLNEVVDVALTIEDAYGNIVTSLYEDAAGDLQEIVTFTTTRIAGSGFYDGTGYDAESVRVPVNPEGTVVATFLVGTEAGPKYLMHIVPDLTTDEKWLTITGIANREPSAITVSVVPNVADPPYLPADGESKFYLTYTLTDEYGNPSGNQSVFFTDEIMGDTFLQRTNSDGQIMFTFGPFDVVGTFTIHAEAMENNSVAIDQVIRFTNTSPDDMLLTANPQSMPSADVPSATGADLIAKVMDEHGNGVPAETVQFFVVTSDSEYSAARTAGPSVASPGTAVTDENGIATLHFTPGAFETDINAANYHPAASDSCTVVATWGAKSRTIDLEWKNYPYLRVETGVEPETLAVGESIDVTVRLVGDGWALYPNPIDVMLCVDRSGSMLTDYDDRMVSLMAALKIFNGEMTENRDAVGMTSFGAKGDVNIMYTRKAGDDLLGTDDALYVAEHYPGNPRTYSDDSTLDLAFTLNRDEVDSAIDTLVPDGYTSMRYGLYLSMQEIMRNGREDAVQAVILLSDGDYNWYGDPLARGEGYSNDGDDFNGGTVDYYRFDDLTLAEQDMSVFAANHDVTIYSIGFGDGLSNWGKSTLRTLAENTGGTYYYAPDGDDLAAIYSDIAGALKTEAGVNTEMDVMFSNIELNNESVPNIPSDPILEYEHEDGISTLVKSWNASGTEGSPNVLSPVTLDQSNDWAANRSLNFESSEIGTINLGQTWQACFRMEVLKPGNINIFGDGSALFFNNGTDSLTLPKTYITALANLNATGINFTSLHVYDLVCAEEESGEVIETYLTLNWNLDYTGNGTAEQYLYYQNMADGIWINFGKIPVTGPVNADAYTRQLYVADFPPGEYRIRVCAMAPDTPQSITETAGSIGIGTCGEYFIRLE